MTAPLGPFEARALADLRAQLRAERERIALLEVEAERAAAEAREAAQAAERAELELLFALRREARLRARVWRLKRAGGVR